MAGSVLTAALLRAAAAPARSRTSGQFGLCIGELAGQIIDPCLSGGQKFGKPGDFLLPIFLQPSSSALHHLDLLGDVRPITSLITVSPAASLRGKALCISNHRRISSP
jgi:hypothetical protein